LRVNRLPAKVVDFSNSTAAFISAPAPIMTTLLCKNGCDESSFMCK
jgi:hypothetical protein